MRKHGRPTILALALAGLLATACGGGDGDSDGNDPVTAPATEEATTEATTTDGAAQPSVVMQDNRFTPASLAIGPSELQILNAGTVPHTFTIDETEIDVELDPGATATQLIELDPGAYRFYCRFHAGMEGELTVADA